MKTNTVTLLPNDELRLFADAPTTVTYKTTGTPNIDIQDGLKRRDREIERLRSRVDALEEEIDSRSWTDADKIIDAIVERLSR